LLYIIFSGLNEMECAALTSSGLGYSWSSTEVKAVKKKINSHLDKQQVKKD
jgi:hypothetical protein